MEVVPIEYLWQYNPVTGRVAGAHQNYGERINILHANRHLFNRMQTVQKEQNKIASARGLATLTGGSFVHFVPSAYDAVEEDQECERSQSLEGSGEPDQVDNLRTLALAAEEARVRANPLLTTQKFVQEFPPVVYEHPFSGDSFPLEFNPLYSPQGNEFTSKNLGGGSLQLTGPHPKLSGGFVALRGQAPKLGKT
ncbi:pVIII [Siadenovirus carbocapituli]|uniref:PVIII n=1 Tax=Siadenovirus sp. TaxID=2671519 RepID=A0A9E7QY43_9ADEN|nr:pVIII [Siadenovirus sp.]